MTADPDWPDDGKVFVAANPWLLAALAKREGLPTDRFRESELVPDGQVLTIDLGAFKTCRVDTRGGSRA